MATTTRRHRLNKPPPPTPYTPTPYRTPPPGFGSPALGTASGVGSAHPPTKPGVPTTRPGYGTPYTPYKPPETAPPGTYDPQLDTQGYIADDEYTSASGAYEEALTRAGIDFWKGVANLDQSHKYTLADLQQASTRDLQNFQTATGDLGTRYGRLGTSQTQSANAAGVGSGGALVAAAAARAGNQATDQSKLQTVYDRQQQDIGTQRERADTAFNTGIAGLQQAHDRQTYDIQHPQDLRTAEYIDTGKGLPKEEVWQAAQAGLLAPPPPDATLDAAGNEIYKTVPGGGSHKGIIYHKYPDGHLVAVGRVPTPPATPAKPTTPTKPKKPKKK